MIYIDFNRMNYRTNPLDVELDAEMDRNAHRNGIQLHSTDYKGKFSELLETLGGNGRKSVVLIDEYDKAITDFLGEDEARLRDNVRTLKNFYGTLKSLDRCIHFALITGVSKYGKVSIFSDLNNLKDITLHRDFSVLLGITQEELERLSADDALLETADIQHAGLYALLFQTGYLTIKKMSLRNGRPQYLLSYPNGEVPYQITRTDEAYFHSIVHVILSLTGFVVHSEIPTNQGRMDAVLDTGKHIYIFEFKLRENADAALAQIRERGYPERFRASGRTLTLVGVAFDTEQKNVREWKTEEG